MEPLRLHQVRVLLALKSSTRSLTIKEITMATALDTPSGIPIGEKLVRRALSGESAGGPNSHEPTGYTGLLKCEFVIPDGPDGDRYRFNLPDPRPGPGSAGEYEK
jgi:hypothetical protein